MGDTLLAKWLMYYDPVHRGWTPSGIANGVCATGGFSFPRIRGGYNLRRAEAGTSIAMGPVVGATGCDATSVRTFPWVRHACAAGYTYCLHAVGGGGMENFTNAPTAEALFDANGVWTGARPNAPADLRVMNLAGGRFLVRWTYNATGEQTPPGEFRIYADAGAGEINYAAPVAVISHRRGRFHYEYLTPPFAHGTHVRWAVRAAAADGDEEPNDRFASGWAEAQPPPINPAVLLSCKAV